MTETEKMEAVTKALKNYFNKKPIYNAFVIKNNLERHEFHPEAMAVWQGRWDTTIEKMAKAVVEAV